MTQRILSVALSFVIGASAAFTSAPTFAKDGMQAWMDRALRDIMEVHFYGPKETDRRRSMRGHEYRPTDLTTPFTVKPVVPLRRLGKSLKCDQLQPQSIRDWQEQKTFDENGHPRFPALSAWNLPVYLQISPAKNFILFDTWPISISMAVIGGTFEIEHILNGRGDRIATETLFNTHDLYEYRFEEIEENYLYGRPIQVLARKQCDGFRIFDFKVKENG